MRSCKLRKDEQHVTEAVHAASQVPQNTIANVEDTSVNCNDTEAEAEVEAEELVTCTPQIFDKNSVDKAAPMPVSIVWSHFFLISNFL